MRRGEGGRGERRGSTAKVPLAVSMLNVMAGLMDLLFSARVVGTLNPTGPTPRPALALALALGLGLAIFRGAVPPIDGELVGFVFDRGFELGSPTFARG